jgi:hypothetical protein
MTRWLLIFLLAAVFSCQEKDNRPAGLIPPKKMELLLWDYLRADVYCNEFLRLDSLQNDDTLRNQAMQNKIFAFYKVSRKDFYDSYQYYMSNPPQMLAIIDSMVAHQQKNKPKNALQETYQPTYE